MENYKEYETAARFLKEGFETPWKNHNGVCWEWGMDAEPVIYLFGGWKYWGVCFWCAEFYTITNHLSKNGIRRFKRAD